MIRQTSGFMHQNNHRFYSPNKLIIFRDVSDDEHRTMYIGNFMVVDQVTQSDDDLNAFGRRYGEPHRPPDNSGYHRLILMRFEMLIPALA